MIEAQSVRKLLADRRLPTLETRMLLQHVLQVPRIWLLTHDTDGVSAEQVARFHTLVEQRLSGSPMAYLVGMREFMGHRFKVSPAVLIPRPDTELLVETAIECLNHLAAPTVLDLGTGSGAIAVSLALACPDATVVATDFSVEALSVASQNAQILGAQIQFLCGSWYQALESERDLPVSQATRQEIVNTAAALAEQGPQGRTTSSITNTQTVPSVFDLIVSNPPYIAHADPHLEQGDLRFEPACALTDGADGLAALRIIAQGAAPRLKSGGALWMEHGWDQAAAVRDLLRHAGFIRVESRKDLAGIERISGGWK